MHLWIPSIITYIHTYLSIITTNTQLSFVFFSYDNIMDCAGKRDSIILRLVVGKREKKLAYKTKYVRLFHLIYE